MRKNVKKIVSVVLCAGMISVSPLSNIVPSPNVMVVEAKENKITTGIVSKTNYARNFKKDGTKGLKKVKGKGNYKVAGNSLNITSVKDDETIVIDEKSPSLYNSEVEFTFDPKNDNQGGMYGIVLRYAKDGSWTFIGQDGHSAKDPVLTTWVMCTSDGKKEKLWTDGQRIYAGRQKPYTVKVRVIDNTVTLFLDNAMVFSGEVEGMTKGTGKAGLRYVNESGAKVEKFNVKSATLPKENKVKVSKKAIASKELTVNMDKAFPRVIDYTLKSNKQKMYGQEIPYYVTEINNILYKPEVTSKFTNTKAIYHLNIKEIGVSFDVNYEVKKNTVEMSITNIKDKKTTVKTINFPNQSIVSIRNTQKNAELRVNDYRHEKTVKLEDAKTQKAYYTTSIATLSSDNIAASISNGNINNRQEIAYQTTKKDNHTTTGLWTNEYQYKGLDNKVIDKLWTKVTITADRNNDKKVDYQDAAIARRDDIGTKYNGSEDFRNSFSMIAMDVGSIAQYPFLRILDNVKKFNAGTDGFEQSILIKGYQSEGHDASHPDFANISTRAGGEADFKTLLNEAPKYGANIGVHINHTEAYPEAKQYAKNLLSATDGWTWYDDSMHIIRENDILDQKNGLEKRLDDLDRITDGKLSMVYVDTYQDSRWQAHKISDKLKKLGWSVGTEYSEELIKNSAWSHTIDSGNIDYNTTGNLVRFIENENKDIFGNSPLFRGLVNRNKDAGFDGWQSCFSYDATIENFFTKVLPQKYLANYPVSKWIKADEVVLGSKNEVTTKMVNGVNEISKDGKIIAQGNKIFIPWNPKTEEKIYHWNEAGGNSTWELPTSWKNLKNVKVFKLTDEGRTNETVLDVVDNKVTINAAAKSGYVVYKGSSKVTKTDMASYNWSAGSPVKDMGFDSHTFSYAWDKESTSGNVDHIQFVDNSLPNAADKDVADNKVGNTHLHVQGGNDATVSQTMTGLKPGQAYSASVFVEGSDYRKLSIEVTTSDGKKVENYTDMSNVKYGNPHNDRFGTYYQRVKLLFTQPEGSTTAVIKLKADKDSNSNSWANFDNVRVTPVKVTDQGKNYFYEDFENVDQEFGPFVVPTKVTQSHLSERNGSWTKDVIDGRYSLKVRGNGDKDAKFNYMRTVPHRIRFAPNTTYEIDLKYMITDVAANAEVLKGKPAFTLGVKSDKAKAVNDTNAAVVLSKELTSKNSLPAYTGVITFTTGNYDDYYIDLLDETYSHEFVIDNICVNVK